MQSAKPNCPARLVKYRPITRVCFVAAALWHICMLLLSQNGKKQCMEISTEDAVSDKWLSDYSIRFPSFSRSMNFEGG